MGKGLEGPNSHDTLPLPCVSAVLVREAVPFRADSQAKGENGNSLIVLGRETIARSAAPLAPPVSSCSS